MLILNAGEVRSALPMDQAIRAMRDAIGALARGEFEMPLRTQLAVRPHQGITLLPWCPKDLRAAGSAREALRDADIVCTATTSAEPVFADTDLAPGTHINAIGAYQAHTREIPGATVARAKVIVDQRAAALEEAGDLVLAIKEKRITVDHLYAELSELVAGSKQGHRQLPTDRSLTGT